MTFESPRALGREDKVAEFDCGKEALNSFLIRHALANQQNGSARTFVSMSGANVAGYYSLAASAVMHEDAPDRMTKGLARHPVPIILMARFGVDLRFQGLGLGRAMFRDAILRAYRVSGDIGARAFVVHAKDEGAKLLYEKLDMQAFSNNPFHLFLLMKDIERAIQ